MYIYEELRRRNVIRVATAYVVAAWLLVQVAETVMPLFGFTDQAVRNVVVLLAIGLIPVAIGAWVFQVTPEGLVRDRGKAAGIRGSPRTDRLLDRAIIVLLALGISYFAVDKFLLAPGREAEIAEQARTEAQLGFYGERSIAVLPFDNLSADPEQQYFADGVAEEVLNLLARIRDLRVISRSSAFTFRDRNVEIPEIAERLNVGYVLEGSVRRAGDRVRITALLIEGRTDMHVWSHTYERELGDVFLIQDEIAAHVVSNLELKMTGGLPKSRPVDPQVLALTQQAKHIWNTGPEDTGQKMYLLLEQALRMDPDYVPALSWMTGANWFRAREGQISREEEYRLRQEINARIRALDPNDGGPDTADAWDLANAGRYEEAAALYQRALSKDLTESDNIRIAGVFALRIGRFDVALRLHEYAVAIDPLCFICLLQLSRTHLYAGNYEHSLELRERYMLLGSGRHGHYHYGLTLLLMGRAEEALDHYLAMPDENPQTLAGRAMAFHTLGRAEDSRAAMARLRAIGTREAEQLTADAASWTGDDDAAFEWLFRATAENLVLPGPNVFYPVWRPLHDDPRWAEWREVNGLTQARFDAIDFDPELPE